MDEFTAQEIQKRYSNCFAYISDNGENKAVKFRDFVIGGGTYKALVDVGSGHVEEVDMRKMEIFPIQHRKLFQVGPTFCLFSRRPARQYRKGYNSDNTFVLDVVTTSMQDHNIHVYSDKYSAISYDTVKAFHTPLKPETFESAVEQLKKDKVGVAITSTFGLALSFVKGADYILFYLHKPIALISGNEFKVLNLKQEVVDFVKYFSKGGYNVVTE